MHRPHILERTATQLAPESSLHTPLTGFQNSFYLKVRSIYFLSEKLPFFRRVFVTILLNVVIFARFMNEIGELMTYL